jgi:hypothetical protein
MPLTTEERADLTTRLEHVVVEHAAASDRTRALHQLHAVLSTVPNAEAEPSAAALMQSVNGQQGDGQQDDDKSDDQA